MPRAHLLFSFVPGDYNQRTVCIRRPCNLHHAALGMLCSRGLCADLAGDVVRLDAAWLSYYPTLAPRLSAPKICAALSCNPWSCVACGDLHWRHSVCI